MTTTNLILGLQIIQKTVPKDESDYNCSAEHDTIYAGDLVWEISKKDREMLLLLEWEEDEDIGRWRADM